jgi:putative RecB family exonuclease
MTQTLPASAVVPEATRPVNLIPNGRLSPSRLMQWRQCPRKLYYTVVSGQPLEPSAEMYRGTLVHRALELYYAQTPPRKLDTEYLESALAQEAPQQGAWRSVHGPVRTLQELVQDALQTLKRWVQMHPELESVTQLAAEWPIEVTQLPGIPVALYGILDRVEVVDERARLVDVVDYKTGKYSDFKVRDYTVQLAIYGIAVRMHMGRSVRLHKLYWIDTGQVTQLALKSAQLDAIVQNIRIDSRAMLQAHTQDQCPPRPSRLCHYCEFNTICPAAQI